MHSRLLLAAALQVGAIRRFANDDNTLSDATILKGISYGPVPLKATGQPQLPHDDFFNDDAEIMWHGRGDLAIMKEMGANAVRLYGNHPGLQHGKFLETASALGMTVIPGMSDYPYTQMPGNCLTTNFSCYAQVRDSYKMNLQSGFLRSDMTYHASLKSFILINEPDLKLGPLGKPEQMKALLSALDGALDAEKEVGVVNPNVRFTMTFSFAVCTICPDSQKPALGQMLQLRAAMKDPSSVGYDAKNDLWQAYQTRFDNSFNTANPSSDLKPLILDDYNKEFKDLKMPIFIGEYHPPNLPNLKADLSAALALAQEPNTLYGGLSFFEWQVRYDKGGSEMEFGMFGLGTNSHGKIVMEIAEFDVWCLSPVVDETHSQNVPEAVAGAFGGKVPTNRLCKPAAAKIE